MPNKDSFSWGENQTKYLSPRDMMRLTKSVVGQTLDQIKTIRHLENLII